MLTAPLIALAERGFIPDPVVRAGIKLLLRQRLRREHAADPTLRQARQRQLLERMAHSPMAVHTQAANQQHYELPPAFFALWLGPRMKYSACHWSSPEQSLAQAEIEMLHLTATRVGIENGMEVLDLGCGWGSMTLWLAETLPDCRLLAVSNSHLQRAYIETEAGQRGLRNVKVCTADMNHFEPGRQFDRIVSVEMFEHMRNYLLLLARVAEWLTPAGKLFVHIFCHQVCAYFFETDESSDWMARYFFTGGLMPSENLLEHFQNDLVLTQRWRVNGRHYERTARAWLAQLDSHKDAALDILRSTYLAEDATRWFARWRLFLLACAELFAYRQGKEWFVAHYLFEKRSAP